MTVIRARSYSYAGGWGTDTTISAESPYNAIDPVLDADAYGNVLVAWRLQNEQRDTIGRAWLAPGGIWNEPETMVTDGATTFARIAMNNAGDAVMLWGVSGSQAGTYDLAVSRYTPGGDWAAADKIQSGGSLSISPLMKLDGSGTAMIVWNARTDNRMEIWSSRYWPR